MPLIILSPSRLLSISNGDTLDVKLGVRMLGIDSPELHFPEGKDVAKTDPLLAGLPKNAAFKKLPKELRAYLAPRLKGAGSRQKEWGLKAKEALKVTAGKAVAAPQAKPGPPPKPFMACGPQVFDRYGRILAYMGPWASKEERAKKGPPETYNLQMLRGGWAAPCIHRENLPKKKDLDLAVKAVKAALAKKLGAWADPNLLIAYEFRALVRMALNEGGFCYQVQDLRTLGKANARVLPPAAYFEVPVEYRLFG